MPRHAATTPSRAAVTTDKTSGFRAIINRGPRHHRRQRASTWSPTNLFIRMHHIYTKTAPTAYSQAQHHDHRLPLKHAKNTQRNANLRRRSRRPAASIDPPRCFPSPTQPLIGSPSAGAGWCSRCWPAGATSPALSHGRAKAVVGTLSATVEPCSMHPAPGSAGRVHATRSPPRRQHLRATVAAEPACHAAAS